MVGKGQLANQRLTANQGAADTVDSLYASFARTMCAVKKNKRRYKCARPELSRAPWGIFRRGLDGNEVRVWELRRRASR